MKKLVLLFTALLLGTAGTMASTTEDKVATRNAYTNNNSFIFVEQGITFSVYPDGEFDFYIENYVSGRKNGITMNSGYDYSPYTQYDDYGAVIQVENVPIYYDHYGRVTQIGDVDVRYRNNRVFRMGGMYVYYNRNGFYDYHTGYINMYNRQYVYRPFHRFFLRPSIGFSLVLNRPYRRYYTPHRYTYYRPYRFNKRRAYAKIGREHRYNQVRRERATIYRNDKRVAQRANDSRRNSAVRSNRTVARNNNSYKNHKTNNNRGNVVRNTGIRTSRSNNKVAGRTSVDRSKSVQTRSARTTNTRSTANRNVTKRSTTRSPQRNTVTQRSVTKTPRSTTVTRSTTTYKKPVNRTQSRSVRSTTTRTQRSVAKRPSTSRSTSKSTVRKSPSRSTKVATRSSSSRSSSRRY